jgi:UDP-glucose 4-epimerase
MNNPLLYHKHNINSSLNIIQLAVKMEIKSLIFSSTAAVYGNPERLPILEDSPLKPINPYGASKMMVEKIIEDSCLHYDINAAVFRFFNVAGADPLNRSGESHDPETHLIPNIINGAKKDHFNINIYGNDHKTEDGTCVRDYVHVSDIANAHMLAVTWLEINSGFNVFNLGSESGYSVKEVVLAAEKAINKNARITYLTKRLGDPPVLIADSEKAKLILGWQQKFNLEEMIQHSHAWQKQKK